MPRESALPQDDRPWASGLILAAWLWGAQHAAWLISASLHFFLALCVAGVALHEHRRSSAPSFEAVLGESVGMNSNGFDSIDTPAGGGNDRLESGDQQELTAVLMALPVATSGELASQQGMSSLLEGTGGAGDSDGLGGSGGGSGGGIGDGHGPGMGPGFFGTQGEGRSFIYIVDMSGSMGGDRFQRAIAEMIRSVNRLKPHQEFYVFFFNDRTYPLFDPKPATRMIMGTPANKARANRWIRSRRPTGLTNPMFALEQALEMKPDVIYLLTDGEIDNADEVREMIRKRNRGASIHTIAFENPEGAATLEAIAKENKGVFRFVN